MCTLNDDFEGKELFQKDNNIMNPEGLICRKCNIQKAEVTLRKKDVYCNACFLINATHKFRATLGKSKIVRPDDKILVGYNGKTGSTALLNLIRAGMHESVHKRLMFSIKVLYINDGIIKGETAEEQDLKIAKITKKIEDLGFEGYIVPLSEALSPQSSIKIQKNVSPTPVNLQKLTEIWNKLIDETSKKDFHQKMKKNLIIAVAKFLQCQKIFLADDSTSLAIKILSNVALGRGAQLSSDCGFIDKRDPDVMILRPIRDFNRLELIYYLKINNIECLEFEKIMKNPSIQQLTNKFVNDLEDKFGGTVSTIFRTGEKIFVKEENPKNYILDDFCVFCHGYLDTNSLDDTSSIEATNFSKIVSLKGFNGDFSLEKLVESEKNCDNCNCGRNRGKGEFNYEELREFLCYSCRLIFREDFGVKLLPNNVRESVIERLRLKNISDEIKDFLL